MTRWTRRTMLFGGVLLALPLAGFAGGKLWCLANSLPGPRIADLLRPYSFSSALKALGKRYLELPGAMAAASLRRLHGDACLTQALETGCSTEIASAIAQTCRDDFSAGRVYCVDGWVLSQTELDVAALAAMEAARWPS
jgi:hypothetical protein